MVMIVIVIVIMMMMLMTMISVGFGFQPVGHIWIFLREIKEARADKSFCRDLTFCCI